MKYDDASWHYGGNFPKKLPNKAGATHIGMFLAWAIENDLISDFHKEDSKKELEAVRNRKMTGAEFLISMCDEKFTDEDLNDIGNKFAKEYYENHYNGDYYDILGDTIKEEEIYYIKDSWENYDILKPIIDKKFEEWKKENNKELS